MTPDPDTPGKDAVGTGSAVLRVALPVPLPRLFDYLAPEGVDLGAMGDLIGHRVQVPFGQRELVGVVTGTGEADPDAPALRAALAFLDGKPVLAGELLGSLRWLARYLHAPLGEVLATALPAALRRGKPLPDPNGKRRGRADPEVTTPVAALEPNPEQRAAIDAIAGASGGFASLLLDGVTGSGKTEVYLQAIAGCLARGRQALVLVPEIGLTPQMLQRFRARLGVPVHAMHSGLTDNARARVWAAAAQGQARVIVGTRSAVFVPLPDAGLIVVDEEHDGSYKQLDGIRYHARDFALVRGQALGVPVVLGSATPSLESLHNARAGRHVHLRLTRRAGDAAPPTVRVLDVRKRPLDAGLSPEAVQAIGNALASGGQVLVFRNRRGYAPVLLCHDCGWSAQCPRCSTATAGSAMTVHAAGKRLQCHHCGLRRPAPPACPDCAGLALQPQGVGTERLEEVLAARFPDVPVLRIDRGSTRKRDALESMLDELGDAPGILVGTQMLAKGHDLPQLALVVVAGIDEGLFSADFRAPEKLAQLLVQVAGRAGRAARRGEVLLQTHHPGHPLLQLLVTGGYHAFADTELAQRDAAAFPPFAHFALLRAEAKDIESTRAFLAAARGQFEAALGRRREVPVQLYGPLPAPMPRRAGFQRMQLLLSATVRRDLHALLDATANRLHALPEARKVRWSLDVDPTDLY